MSGTGRITLDNTMEERLRLLEDKVIAFSFSIGTNALMNISLLDVARD